MLHDKTIFDLDPLLKNGSRALDRQSRSKTCSLFFFTSITPAALPSCTTSDESANSLENWLSVEKNQKLTLSRTYSGSRLCSITWGTQTKTNKLIVAWKNSLILIKAEPPEPPRDKSARPTTLIRNAVLLRRRLCNHTWKTNHNKLKTLEKLDWLFWHHPPNTAVKSDSKTVMGDSHQTSTHVEAPKSNRKLKQKNGSFVDDNQWSTLQPVHSTV